MPRAPTPRAAARVACLCAALAGCAAGGDPGDGGSNLPERGFGGYARLLDDAGDPIEPVPRPDGATLGDPFARVIDGRVELYVTLCPDGDVCRIARADSADGVAFGALEPVAEDPGGLTAPFVWGETLYAVAADGVIAVEAGERRIVLPADGAALDAPSVVEVDGPWLYLTRDDGDGPRVMRAPLGADGAGALEPVDVPPLDAWAPPAVLQPEVRRATTAAGRTVYRMVYAGRPGAGDADLAFAASFDGVTFSNWPFDPALGGDADEASPTNIRLGDRYILYYGRRGRLGVAARDADNPTEAF